MLNKIIIAVMLSLFLSMVANMGWPDSKGTVELLEKEGYTDVTIKGRQTFGCDGEFFHTAFVAKNSRGIPVKGLVCKKLFSDHGVIKRK